MSPKSNNLPTVRAVAELLEAELDARDRKRRTEEDVATTSQARSAALMKFPVGTVLDLGNGRAIRVTSGYGSYEEVTILR